MPMQTFDMESGGIAQRTAQVTRPGTRISRRAVITGSILALCLGWPSWNFFRMFICASRKDMTGVI